MREDEKKIAKLVEDYINTILPSKKVSVSDGEDPPDAYLHYENDKFPFEITTTEIPRDPTFGEPSIRELTYENSHIKLIKDIEQKVINKNLLSGVYVLNFQRPLDSEDFSSTKSIFTSEVLDILRKSQSENIGFADTVIQEFRALAWIYKIHDQGSMLSCSFQDGAWPESPEFINFYRSVLSNSIDTKIEKFSKVCNTLDGILAIRNSYPLVNSSIIMRVCKGINKLSSFHTVIIVHENVPLIVHSSFNDWT
jgi:hypothetical protein